MKLETTKTLARLAASLLFVLEGGAALAQTPTEVNVDRETDELKVLILPDPGRTMTDTALVFTNPGDSPATVRCNAYDKEGDWIGRTRTLVPGHGLRYIRASDLSGGSSFLGSARCWSARHTIGTGYLVTREGITATRVVSNRHEATEFYRFPVIGYF
ncbi:MAG: hypothetical protein AAGA81_07025 [Acidobacteriota bacterium]